MCLKRALTVLKKKNLLQFEQMTISDIPIDPCMMPKIVNRKKNESNNVPYLAYEGSWLFQYILEKLTMNQFMCK